MPNVEEISRVHRSILGNFCCEFLPSMFFSLTFSSFSFHFSFFVRLSSSFKSTQTNPRDRCYENHSSRYSILHLKRFVLLFCSVLFCFVLFCFVLFCFVLFCFVLFCFVLFCFVLFCFVLFCFVLFCFVLFCFVLFFCFCFCFCFVLFCFIVLYCIVLYCIVLYCIVLYLYLFCLIVFNLIYIYFDPVRATTRSSQLHEDTSNAMCECIHNNHGRLFE